MMSALRQVSFAGHRNWKRLVEMKVKGTLLRDAVYQIHERAVYIRDLWLACQNNVWYVRAWKDAFPIFQKMCKAPTNECQFPETRNIFHPLKSPEQWLVHNKNVPPLVLMKTQINEWDKGLDTGGKQETNSKAGRGESAWLRSGTQGSDFRVFPLLECLNTFPR